MHLRSRFSHKLWLILIVSLMYGCNLGDVKLEKNLSNDESTYINELPNSNKIFVLYDDLSQTKLEIPPEKNIRWFYYKAKPLDYSNPDHCGGRSDCIAPIQYEEREIDSLRGKPSFLIGDVPELSSLGTHEIMGRANDTEYRFQVVVRRDNSYVGYLTELIGVPFVYVPFNTPGGHQTDLRLGADCIALVIYGKRRQGYIVPYMAPTKVYDYVDRIGKSSAMNNTTIKEGDILHFGFQTAVLALDRMPVGELSDNDLIIHTYHGLAEEIPFKDIPYKEADFDLLRWRMQ